MSTTVLNVENSACSLLTPLAVLLLSMLKCCVLIINCRVTDSVLNIDLTPTFIDIAEAPVPETMDGVSILKLFDTNG